MNDIKFKQPYHKLKQKDKKIKRVFFFDMDGTILPNTTGLLETARYFKTEKELLKLENDFSKNLLDTAQFTKIISKLWGIISNKTSGKIFNKTKKMKGLKTCFKHIRKNGDYSCIITLSQDFFTDHFKDYGVDYIFSTPYPPNHKNEYNLKCLTADDKKKIAIKLCKELGVQPENSVAFGDSSGDLPIFEAVGYSIAINPKKDLSKYVALTYRGNSILEAYKAIEKYIVYIQNPNTNVKTISCKNIFYGRTVIATAFSDCIKELYNQPNKEIEFKNLWLNKIKSNPRMTENGWYDPPKYGMAVLFSKEKAAQRSHFTTYRDPKYFSSELEIDWETGIITGYASNVDKRTKIPCDFGTTVYLGNDHETVQYIEQCIFISEAVFILLENNVLKTSAELFNAANMLFNKYSLLGNSYSSTSSIWNLGHTI